MWERNRSSTAFSQASDELTPQHLVCVISLIELSSPCMVFYSLDNTLLGILLVLSSLYVLFHNFIDNTHIYLLPIS